MVAVRIVVQQVVIDWAVVVGVVDDDDDDDDDNCSRTYKTVHFEHSYFKIARGTERRIVERLAAVRLAEANVFVHPDCLSLTSPDRDHLGIGGHE